MCIPYDHEHMPKILKFEQLLKHILRVYMYFRVCGGGGGGGGKFNSMGLDHSGSQPFIYGSIDRLHLIILLQCQPLYG